jgi:PAS domain S-box-containing protein
MDPEGRIEYVNHGYEHITGYRRDEVLEKRHHLFEPSEHDEAFYIDVQETLLKGTNWSGRFARTRKDGSSYTEDIILSPVRSSVGKIVNYVALKRDVSKELSMQYQLLQAQKMEAVGTLAGGIAHDFNNILQVVLGYSEFLLAAKEKTDNEYADLDKIYSASRRGADLVQNLMMFSRKVQPNLKPLNLNDEIVQIQKLLSRTIPKNIKINVHLSGDLELVEADISQMGQVLMNLAVNARDAMPDGGKLNFETSNVNLDEDYCATHPNFQPGNYALLGVSDTGIGMDEETLSHIFEPFFTTKGVGHGTGLGLATVFGIIKQHKGHITCESEMGTGTTFKIYIPAIEKKLEGGAQESRTPIVGGTETILLVDDEEHLRDLGSTILKRYGYEVLTTENGREALEAYIREREKISLIVLDLIMPEMDGKKCLSEILHINPKAKVLIASGYSPISPTIPSLLPGAKGLVAKPYQMRKLLKAVREVLDAV